MIKAAIIGATGYAGAMLTSLLSAHPEVELTSLTSHSYSGKPFSSIYPAFRGVVDNVLEEDNARAVSEKADVLFFCLPAGLASDAVDEEMLKKCRVIDLGADFRFSDVNTYKEWYKKDHGHPELLEKAVYGLPEIHRSEIKGAALIGNPGCYTTCSILALYPLVKEHLIVTDSIIIDAKSGVSGAGRSEKIGSLFCECNESIKPYGIKSHRHTPEIEKELALASGEAMTLQFTPHLVPMERGILSCCYAKAKKGVTKEEIDAAYKKCYGDEYFIRILDSAPETRFVKGSNSVDIYPVLDERTGNVMAFSALDNLVKGAAGQAVQNMNILFDLDEKTGLMKTGKDWI
jgi:N-acetyl-gamma-glutamyl-phosphate reductase, common form